MSCLDKLDLRLIRPALDFKNSFLDGYRELTNDSERFSWVYLGEAAGLQLPIRDFNAYVESLLKRETDAPAEFVRDTVYWAVAENEIVGRISIRHELNDFLKVAGGHIGYIVRPSFRGKGIASEMLRQILLTPRAKLLGKLLVTCDENNLASSRTILRNGGILESVIEVEAGKSRKKRYWIQIPY